MQPAGLTAAWISHGQEMDLDQAFTVVGEFGWYQKKVTCLLVLLQIYVACQSMLIVLVGAVPEYHIVNEDFPIGKDELVKHVRFANNFTSIVSEWYLIKHEAYKVNLASSLFFVGLLIGNILFGPLSDKLGRRPVYLTGLCFDIIFGYLSAFAPSYEVFAVSRLFVGIMNGGMTLVSFVLTQEYVGKSYWALTGSLTNLTFAVGIAFYALLGYYIRNWRTLAIIANSPGLFFFLLSFLLPESPRWLYSQGCKEKAEEVLQYMAHGNGKECLAVNLKECTGAGRAGDSAHGVCDLVKYGVLRWRTVILMYIWMSYHQTLNFQRGLATPPQSRQNLQRRHLPTCSFQTPKYPVGVGCTLQTSLSCGLFTGKHNGSFMTSFPLMSMMDRPQNGAGEHLYSSPNT